MSSITVEPVTAAVPATTPPFAHGQAGADTAPTAPPSAAPASQVAPVLIAFRQNGTDQDVSIQLHPIELGRVSIKIGRTTDGPASVSISAERPETLALLQRDQTQLRDALNQAGLPQTTQSLSFHLAASLPESGAQSGSGNGQQPTYDPHGQQAPSGGPDQSGSQGSGSDAHLRQRADTSQPDEANSTTAPTLMSPAARPPRTRAWTSGGLSITA